MTIIKENKLMATKEELLQKMSDMVFEMEDEDIAEVCEEYIEEGYDALDGILHGLVDGMNRASDMYHQEEYFVTDLLLCSDAMYAGLDVLRPHLPEDASTGETKKAVIGVVEGDTHDIGKNLVKIMMPGMREVINKLKEQGMRDSVKVMVGGSPISMKYAEDIGADGYSRNAVEAVEVAKKLCGMAD